jgi:hypothetical protein
LSSQQLEQYYGPLLQALMKTLLAEKDILPERTLLAE